MKIFSTRKTKDKFAELQAYERAQREKVRGMIEDIIARYPVDQQDAARMAFQEALARIAAADARESSAQRVRF